MCDRRKRRKVVPCHLRHQPGPLLLQIHSEMENLKERERERDSHLWRKERWHSKFEFFCISSGLCPKPYPTIDATCVSSGKLSCCSILTYYKIWDPNMVGTWCCVPVANFTKICFISKVIISYTSHELKDHSHTEFSPFFQSVLGRPFFRHENAPNVIVMVEIRDRTSSVALQCFNESWLLSFGSGISCWFLL